jgi:uncharacterized protein (DUF433 family)
LASLDWSQCPAVESIPGKVSGAWVFKGTRLPVATVIENLEDLSVDEIIEQFDVTREQVTAVLEFVAESLRSEVPAGARPATSDDSPSLLRRRINVREHDSPAPPRTAPRLPRMENRQAAAPPVRRRRDQSRYPPL